MPLTMTAILIFAILVTLAALVVLWRESKTRFKPPKDYYKEKEQ